jgi:transcriptional regulator GlxA family with amidase domain
MQQVFVAGPGGMAHRQRSEEHRVNQGEQRARRAHNVAVLAAHPAPAIDLAVPTAVFGTLHPTLLRDLPGLRDWYELRVCGGDLEPARRPVGAAIDADRAPDVLATADTIIVAAGPDVPPDPQPGVRRALRQARARRARLVGIGSGAFVLAAAGVLAGRRATAHWSVCDELRRHHPEVAVDDPVLYTEDDDIFTSAGAAATLDLCLELVRQDHGAAVANTLARWLIAPPHRGADQPQFVAAPVSETGDRLSELLEWASTRLDQPLTLADLARAAGVSPRTLARRFHAALGTTPLQWLLTQRIRRAQELLESTDQPVDRIAERSGFGSAGNLRHQFTRALGMSPQRYRRMFRGSAADGAGARSA